MISRYGSLVLAVGSVGGFSAAESVVTSLALAGFAAAGSVVTSLAGFDAGGRLNSTERPAQLAERDDLLLLLFAQDIAHFDGGIPHV